jgi:radical SAM superfamily enzyme YgiQ (UPF0313 family)
MKIVFVAFGYENLSIEYLSAVLKKEGHDVSLVFDPALFETYHLSNKLLARLFSHRDRVVKKIISLKPGIVAFSVLSDNYLWASAIARELKNKIKTPIIFGGIHPTSVPENVINEPFVDYVCVGEGEEAMAELIQNLESGGDATDVPNIWAKKNGSIFRNEPRKLADDLDAFPLPDKDLFYEEYPGFTNGIYMTMTSRGCPYQCSYCYNSYLMGIYKGKGSYLRRLSPDRVIRELVLAKEKYDMKRIVFVDDVFTSDDGWLEYFTQEYKKKIGVPFGCLVHPLFVNEKIVALLKDGGCTVAGMGIQTLNESIKRNIIFRSEDRRAIERAIRLFKDKGILIYVDFIFGLPGESQKDAEEIALFLSQARPDAVSTLWLRYYPKTEIIQISKNKNILSQEDEADINKGLDCKPMSDFGNTESIIDRRMVALVLISAELPLKVVRFLLKHKLYRFLPKKNMHHLHTLMKQIFNRTVHAKDGALYSSLRGHLRYYKNYINRYLSDRSIRP